MGKLKTAKRKFGKGMNRCILCGNAHGVINKYDLHYCRKCMREVAKNVGFKKYS